jgi:hypothetical protein
VIKRDKKVPYTARGSAPFTKKRILISGLSKSGKTTSLPSFIYGHSDYWSSEPGEQEAAIEYAANRSMVIIGCPGETGQMSLPPDSPHLTSYFDEVTEDSSSMTSQYSQYAIAEFAKITAVVRKNKPDILAFDGIHCLYNHLLNRNSNGEFLAGMDMDKDESGKPVQYRASRYYNRTRHNITEIISDACNSSIPVVIATSGERWEEVAQESDRPDIANKRYLWPDLSGEMATRIVYLFDARVSARMEMRCLHPGCALTGASLPHHVWQFLGRGDVMGVGIRGLTAGAAWTNRPFIHQKGPTLYQLMSPVVVSP